MVLALAESVGGPRCFAKWVPPHRRRTTPDERSACTRTKSSRTFSAEASMATAFCGCSKSSCNRQGAKPPFSKVINTASGNLTHLARRWRKAAGRAWVSVGVASKAKAASASSCPLRRRRSRRQAPHPPPPPAPRCAEPTPATRPKPQTPWSSPNAACLPWPKPESDTPAKRSSTSKRRVSKRRADNRSKPMAHPDRRRARRTPPPSSPSPPKSTSCATRRAGQPPEPNELEHTKAT